MADTELAHTTVQAANLEDMIMAMGPHHLTDD